MAEVARSLARADHLIFADGYVAVGEAVLRGQDPYALAANTWPPFFLFLAAALAVLARASLRAALLAWQLADILAVWGSLCLLARFFEADRDRLTFWPRSPALPAFATAAVAVPALVSARLVQDNLQHAQINPHLLFLVLLAFHLFRTGRTGTGGLALALAASLKAVPVVLLLYLAYKRRWTAVSWTAGFLIAFNVVLPAAVFGPAATVGLWRRWHEVSAAMSGSLGAHHYNQSLWSALKRLLSARASAPNPIQYNVADLAPAAIDRIFYVTAAAVTAGTAWLWRRHPRDLRHPVCAAEFAVLQGLVTLLSPLAWKAPYITLLGAYFYVWHRLGRLGAGPRRRALWVWWASFACITLSAPVFVGKFVTDRLESLSVITVGAIAIVGLGLWLGARDAAGAEAGSPGRVTSASELPA